MMTIEALISVICWSVSCFSFGYMIGRDTQKRK